MQLIRDSRTKKCEADFNAQMNDPVIVPKLYNFGMTKDEALKACRDEIRGKERWLEWLLGDEVMFAICNMDHSGDMTDKAWSKLKEATIKELMSILSSKSPDKARIEEISTEHYQGQLKVSSSAVHQGQLLFMARQREPSVLTEVEELYDPNRSYLA